MSGMYVTNTVATPNSFFNSTWDSNASEKGADAVPEPAVDAVCQGLTSVSQSMVQIADYFHSNPSEWTAVQERASAVNEQFAELVESMKRYSEDREQLQAAATHVSGASNWIGRNFSNRGSGNVQTIPIGNQAFNALWQQYGG